MGFSIMNFSRKQRYLFLFIMICVSIIIMFYDEFSIKLFLPTQVQVNTIYTDPQSFISKHILESSRNSDIVIFLWENPTSSDQNDWTGILKSKQLITKQQFIDFKKTQQQQQSNENSQVQSQDSINDSIENDNNNICSVSCRFTNIPEELVESHLILFDPIYFEKDNWKRSPLKLPEKHPHQKFGLLHYSSKSQYSLLGSKQFNELLDLNVNYIDSTINNFDVTLACPPNISYSIQDTSRLLLKDHHDWLSRRNSSIFISSNCNDGLSLSRTNLVERLSKIIKIESLGSCLNNNNGGGSGDGKGKVKFMSKEELGGDIHKRIQYNMNFYKGVKFVICFENENSTNYITEKVYTALYAGAIPIWMGAKNIDEWVPSGSIINSNEFKNIDEMGDYINDIMEGRIDYKRFFKWKNSIKLEDKVVDKLKRCISSNQSKCKLCESVSKQLSESEKHYRSMTVLPQTVITSPNHYSTYYTPLYLEMKGLGDHIVVEENQHLCKGCFNLDNHYTIMAWVKPSSFGDQRIVDKNHAGTISGFNFDIQKTSNGRGVVRLCAGADCFESFRSIPNDLWSHVAVVFSCNNFNVNLNRVTFFINGEQNAQYDNFTPTKINDFPLVIGKSGTRLETSSYHGKLDNVMIFNSSLSGQEIKNLLWNKPNILETNNGNDNIKNLILYYDFDNIPSNSNNNHGGSYNRNIIKDRSIYQNDGKLSKSSKDDLSEKVISISKEYSFNNKL